MRQAMLKAMEIKRNNMIKELQKKLEASKNNPALVKKIKAQINELEIYKKD